MCYLTSSKFKWRHCLGHTGLQNGPKIIILYLVRSVQYPGLANRWWPQTCQSHTQPLNWSIRAHNMVAPNPRIPAGLVTNWINVESTRRRTILNPTNNRFTIHFGSQATESTNTISPSPNLQLASKKILYSGPNQGVSLIQHFSLCFFVLAFFLKKILDCWIHQSIFCNNNKLSALTS